MSPRLLFKALLKERLVAAAEEIFHVFESTIVKYEEEICSSKQEIERLKGLLKPNQEPGLWTFIMPSLMSASNGFALVAVKTAL